ncbi:MAG: hypothetical protein LH615_12740 [Ferruginibacter sp.]|nr:hypothetical protein [Ferruginibacter sp.]
MEFKSKYDQRVIKSIISHKESNISEVKDLQSIIAMAFDPKNYSTITSLIKENNWEKIKAFDHNQGGFREYLDILKFTDQNMTSHIVTVYDSDELWQDPEVVDIFNI